MHRQTFPPRSLAWSLALGFLINFSAQAVSAQGANRQLPGFAQQPFTDGAKAPLKDGAEPYILVLPKDSTRQIEMSTKELISEFRSENPKVVKVQALLDNPRAVLVTGLAPGATRVYITDNKKNSESLEVRVPADDEELRRAEEEKNKREGEVKKKRLTELIHQTVPTAVVSVEAWKNIYQSGGSEHLQGGSVITYGGKKWTVILTGTVPLAESVQTILGLAQGVFEDGNVINSMVIPGVQQVQIEVTIARVNRSRARQIGFSFVNTGANHFLASTVGGNGAFQAASPFGTSLLAPLASLTSSQNVVFGIFNDKQSFLGFLTALNTEGLAKLIAEPRVMTLSGRPAKILSGGQTPILTSTGVGAPSVTYKDFGTVVDFLPIVLGNGKIHLDVAPEISSLDQAAGIQIPASGGGAATQVPGFDVRSAKVSVEMEDGQTLAIGGLIQNSINASNNKVPILGDIPFLAFAFTNKTYTEIEEELIILVTPHLVDPMACNQLPKYLPGRETRTADDFELFLEGILEAPRGQRNLTHPYTAAYLNDPSASKYPCGSAGGCASGNCGSGNCASGNCGGGADSPYPTAAGAPQAMAPQAIAPQAMQPVQTGQPDVLQNTGRGYANPPAQPQTPVAVPSAAPQTLPNLPPATGAAPTTGATFGPAVTAEPR